MWQEKFAKGTMLTKSVPSQKSKLLVLRIRLSG